jgi:cytosine/adenosine deaminase-related metal-dependent hydrolase
MSGGHQPDREPDSVLLHGARCATGPQSSEFVSLECAGGRVDRILRGSCKYPRAGCALVNLTGFLLLPGLINAHDHLEFALFPRLADPPYRNYIEWGADIHRKFVDAIALHRSVPKDVRIAWGGIRNLLCGVTTVSHHNPLHPIMLRDDFPVRVIRAYGWAHSPALGGDVRVARSATPDNTPFILHACEGTDWIARQELLELDRLGLLDERAVLVHGLALRERDVSLLIERRASLITCPSSNQFLFGVLPDLRLLRSIPNLSLGNDSPLTAAGDLLDEIRFAIDACGVDPTLAYAMVTTAPAAILRLTQGEGELRQGGFADLIAVRDTSLGPGDRLRSLAMQDVELVMIGGSVRLASQQVLERLPARAQQGLEPLSVDGAVRWLRAPVANLLRGAEEVLGPGQVRLGARTVSIPLLTEAVHVA